MDEEPPNAHLIYEYIIHPSLLPFRLILNIITIPLSFLLSAVLLPLRIIFLPLTASFSILFTNSSSTNPPGPFQFLASALFFGSIAGLTLYLVSRIIFIALGALGPADSLVGGSSTQRLVPIARQVQTRILQQVQRAQEVQEVKDATNFAKSLIPEATYRGRGAIRTGYPDRNTFGSADVGPSRPPINVKKEQHQGQVGGVTSSSDVWEDKWRKQHQDDQASVPTQPFSAINPLLTGNGSGISSPGAQRSISATANLNQTIPEEDSDDMFWDTDET